MACGFFCGAWEVVWEWDPARALLLIRPRACPAEAEGSPARPGVYVMRRELSDIKLPKINKIGKKRKQAEAGGLQENKRKNQNQPCLRIIL